MDYMQIIWAAVLILTVIIISFILIKSKHGKASAVFTDDFDKIDEMNGYEFEALCAELFIRNGHPIIEKTVKSGDYGADIIIEYYGETIAVQCKRQSTPVGVKAVQEAKTAESHYNTARSAVITNNTFTRNAITLADENKVILWDREALAEFITEVKQNDLSITSFICFLPFSDNPKEPIKIIADGITILLEREPKYINLSEGVHILKAVSGKKKTTIKITAVSDQKHFYAVGFIKKTLVCKEILF